MSIPSGKKDWPSSSCSLRNRSLRRPVPIAFQPPAMNLRAAASPKPEVAPVMSTVFIISLLRADSAPHEVERLHSNLFGNGKEIRLISFEEAQHGAQERGIIEPPS